MHSTTFEYLKPTDDQLETMNNARALIADFAVDLGTMLPEGPDKTFIMRELRTIGMWVNASITRNPDGSPRT